MMIRELAALTLLVMIDGRKLKIVGTCGLSAVLVLALVGGCASARNASPRAVPVVAASARPSGPADLELDQILPRPLLPTTHPAASTRPAPIDAIVLYAAAREAILDDKRQEAARLLEQAVALDPNSFELHYELSRVYKGSLNYEVRSMAELRAAAAIEPDSIDARLDLGRQYLARNDAPQATEQFRLAMQTPDYLADSPRAVEVDLFLASTLAAQGYDRAALDRCEKALERLGDRGVPRRVGSDPALFNLASRLYLTVGDLYLKRGEAAQALVAYQSAGGDPPEFEVQARIVRALIALGKMTDAASRAAVAVSRSHASPESVALLREVYRAVGHESDAARELARLHAAHPEDRSVLFALADVLGGDGQSNEADRLLTVEAARSPGDVELVLRRFSLQESAGNLPAAARVLIEAAAAAPGITSELADCWTRLLRLENHARLSLDDLRALDVAETARSAKAYSIARAAAEWPRAAVAKASLADSARGRPVFAPAFRDLLQEIWGDEGTSTQSKIKASAALVDAATEAGEFSLAAELHGRALLQQGDLPDGAAAIAEAVKLDGSLPNLGRPATALTTRPAARNADGLPPDLMLAFAQSLLAFDNAPSFERVSWKLIGEHPHFGAAYVSLLSYYEKHSQPEQVERVVNAWRKAEPHGLASRLAQTKASLRAGRLDVAEQVLDGLYDDFPDEPDVLAATALLDNQSGRKDKLLEKLEARLAQRPGSFSTADLLARTYLATDRAADTVRVLDKARSAAASEPDVLYALSHLYARTGVKGAAEEVLQQVLKLEPANAPAANDLSFAWADQGIHLEEAELLARSAVEQEPENRTYFDSLGWALYKRGQFAEAKEWLLRAAEPGDTPPGPTVADPDPVVLDHLGDTHYQLKEKELAGQAWDRSHQRLTELGEAAADRDDLRPLRLQLEQKRKQLRAGQTVSVAPAGKRAVAGPTTRSVSVPVNGMP